VSLSSPFDKGEGDETARARPGDQSPMQIAMAIAKLAAFAVAFAVLLAATVAVGLLCWTNFFL